MKAAEEKAKKDITAAAKLAEELRSEQDLAIGLEKERKDLEGKVKTLSIQLDDAETSAAKWGRKMAAKLDARARELEAEMDAEQRRTGDATKNLRKVERGIKEYIFKADEDKKNADRMGELATRLQSKVKTYKQQIEEAEEIAALNLAKFRKAQQELEETDERAKLAEQSIGVMRMNEF